MSHKHCQNCGQSIHGKFCSNCGQKADTHRLNWHYLFHDIPHSILHLDKGFFFTAKEMFLRPGKTARAFLDGKRAGHFRPVAYAFILGIIMSLVIYSATSGESEHSEVGGLQVTTNTEAENFEISAETIKYVFSKYYGILVILCVPIYAFFAWTLYRKQRNYVEITTAFLFIFGHTTWFALLLAFLRFCDSEVVGLILLWSWLVLGIGYLLWGVTSLFTEFSLFLRLLASLYIFTFGFIVAGIGMVFGLYFFSRITGH